MDLKAWTDFGWPALRIAFVLIATLLAGCQSKETAGQLVFAAGGAPSEIAEWRHILADYEAAHPGQKVELRTLPADSDLQLQAMTSALASAEAPYDLMRLDGVWITDFSKRGWIAPLDSYFHAPELASYGHLAATLDRVDGRLMALPWNVDVGLLYSRKDLLQALGQVGPPQTMRQLLSLAARAQAEARKRGERLEGFLWQGKAYEGLTCNFAEAYARAGGSLSKVGKTGRWEFGPSLGALVELQGLLSKGISPRNTVTDMDEEACRLLFQSGKAVFMRNWPYAAPLLEASDSAVKSQVWISALPGSKASPGPGALGGWQLAVRKGSPHEAEAVALLRYLCSRKVEVELSKTLGWNPSHLGAYADVKNAENAASWGAVRQALKAAVARPRRQGYAAFSEKSFKTVSQALLGQKPASQAAQELFQP